MNEKKKKKGVASFVNCTSVNNTIYGFKGRSSVGGFVGYSWTTLNVDNCNSENNLIVSESFINDNFSQQAGSFFGYSSGAYFSNSVAIDNIINCNGSVCYAAGFIGDSYSSNITNCTSMKNIITANSTSYSYVGGVFGRQSFGNLSTTLSAFNNIFAFSNIGARAGGIIGRASGTCAISSLNSSFNNIISITSPSSSSSSSHKLYKSSPLNRGSLSSGIASELCIASYICDSISSGNTIYSSGESYYNADSGGVVSYQYISTITNCTSFNNSIISYSNGELLSSTVGGLTSYLDNRSNITNCYYSSNKLKAIALQNKNEHIGNCVGSNQGNCSNCVERKTKF
jgi:hypothetical protein